MYNQASIYKGGGVYKMGEASALPDNYEKPKRYAVVGDGVYADANGNVHFLVSSTINPSTLPSGWEYVGEVALRKGNKATILYKTENTSVNWASMWLFKVNGLKLDGTDSFVLQQGSATGSTPVEVGTFTATAAATDLDTLVSELDTWLRANPTATGALANYNWHAEKHVDADGVDACFIVVDSGSYQTRFEPIKSSTSGATSSRYMWNWVTGITTQNQIKRKDGVTTLYVVWNKDRFKAYNKNVGNPTDSLTTPGIFNESNFNATTTVKKFYGTYDNYLDKMLPDEEATTGAFALFKGKGKEIAKNLCEVSFKKLSGTDSKVFSAEIWANGLKAHSTATVEGLDVGDFYIPSIDEGFMILSTMKTDGSDIINSSLVKAGASPISLSVNRIVPAQSSNSEMWTNMNQGRFSYNDMTTLNYCIAVAEINL